MLLTGIFAGIQGNPKPNEWETHNERTHLPRRYPNPRAGAKRLRVPKFNGLANAMAGQRRFVSQGLNTIGRALNGVQENRLPVDREDWEVLPLLPASPAIAALLAADLPTATWFECHLLRSPKANCGLLVRKKKPSMP
jgi:hypothetical protein